MIEAHADETYGLSQQEQDLSHDIISPEAHVRLSEWGISPEEKAKLETLASRYDYGSCDTKIDRIVENGALIDTERNQIVLPKFSDFEGSQREGHCADITAKSYVELNTNWVAEVNAKREAEGESPLAILYCAGTSRTHFTTPNYKHIWASIVPEDRPIEEAVIVDASFAKVQTADVSGYTFLEWSRPTDARTPTTIQVNIGSPEKNWRGKINSLNYSPQMIGMSKTGNTAISISFIANNGAVRPMFDVVDANGKRACYLATDTTPQWQNYGGAISPEDRAEVEGLMSKIKDMSYIPASSTEVDALIEETSQIVRL